MRHGSIARPVLTLILTPLFGLDLISQAIAPAHAADATLVFAAHEAIVQHHLDRPDPVKLFVAALSGIRQALTDAGITTTLSAPTATEASMTKAQFQAQFDRAVELAHGRITETQLQYAAVRAMAASLGDLRTSFFTPNEWAEFNRKAYGGTGFYIFQKENRIYIDYVLPYYPAARAGLRRFDRILSVDGQDTTALLAKGIRNFADHITGPPGTNVRLVVQRPGQSAALAFSITRQWIQIAIPALAHKMLEQRVGYIRIPALGETSVAEFRRTLVDFQRQGRRGLVLDLRGNQGVRRFSIIADVASALLPKGVPILIVVNRNGRQKYVTSGATLLDPAVPLVVLINERATSLDDILSQAIRQAGRGKLVGMPTPGAVGTVRRVDLPGGAGIIVKTNDLLSGDGTRLAKIGIRPDVMVDLTVQDLDRGIDTQLQRAVQVLSH